MASDKDKNFKIASLDEYKVFCDPVHGHISLHPLLVKIVDTPQFQRLRHIRQLGSKYFVYPGASHNRFEHSIGTAHLAGKLARIIQQQKNPEINFNGKDIVVTPKDVLCVEMAGLCHDLGHGPFSHMFDGVYMKRANPRGSWKHEEGSCDMFDHIIEIQEVRELLKHYVIDDKDKTFVKEMIAGPLEISKKSTDPEKWFPDSSGKPYIGRGKGKSFLYDIISNKDTGVDVDKWDYFARDCHHLGIRNSFDHNRFMMFVKVLNVVDNAGNEEEEACKKEKVAKVEGDQKKQRLHICARDKECENLYEMFHTRSFLHRRAYQHRVAKAIDCMIVEAMELAEPYVKITGKKGVLKKFSDFVKEPEAYTKLNDGVLDLIIYLAETSPAGKDTDEKKDLEKARTLLERVFKRDFYERIGSIKSKTDQEEKIISEIIDRDGNKHEVKEDLISKIKKEEYGRGDREESPCKNDKETTLSGIIRCCDDTEDKTQHLVQGDLTLSIRKVDYGMGRENPVDKFWFYKKSEPNTPKKMLKEDVSRMLPEVFQEHEVLIFCKEKGKVENAKKGFKKWGKEKAEKSNCSQVDKTPEKIGNASQRMQKRGAKRELQM